MAPAFRAIAYYLLETLKVTFSVKEN